jgi:hypothetical protein
MPQGYWIGDPCARSNPVILTFGDGFGGYGRGPHQGAPRLRSVRAVEALDTLSARLKVLRFARSQQPGCAEQAQGSPAS